MRLRWKATISILAAAFSFSCSGIREAAGTFGELQQLQKAVGEAVGAGTKSVSVNLRNGTHLKIGIVNNSLKELPPGQKAVKARELAEVAYRNYTKNSELVQVRVVFVVRDSYLGVFKYEDESDGFDFPASDLSSTVSRPPENQ
jgi:hypothetical protein